MGRGSKRYKESIMKTKGDNMAAKRTFESFNITPGMSTWREMSAEYKKQYVKHIEKLNMDAVKRKELELLERLAAMEKKPKDVIPDVRKKRQPYLRSGENAVSNFIDDKFFDNMVYESTTDPAAKKILLISDVKGWAWWNKSHYLKKYLSDEFYFDITCALEGRTAINPTRYDLYLTYGYSYVTLLGAVPRHKRSTGITAHRPRNILEPYMSKARYLHANSLLLLKELKDMAKEHQTCYYVPNGVDEELFHEVEPIKPEGRLVAGHVGKKCPAKGQEEFILPAIQKAEVESMYNMNDYRSKKPWIEMYKLYQNMDVFVIASVEDGTPNGALEAAACGRPIISNKIGNMPEFIIDGYNGFLLDNRNVDDYVDRLKYLQDNRDKLIEMGKNARKTVEESWTWKIQSENWRLMFRDIFTK